MIANRASVVGRKTKISRGYVQESFDIVLLKGIYVKWISLFAVVVVALCVLHGASATQSYEVVGMQNNIKRLSQESENLRLDVAKLKSPSRIQTIAESELGMVLPSTFIASSKNASIVQKNVVAVDKIRD